jgi:aminoglycoside phosphotransferase (APT) family kinase protein
MRERMRRPCMLLNDERGSATWAGDSPLARWIAQASGARARIEHLERMSGGAIQQNWLLDVSLDGRLSQLVLRTDGQSSLAISQTRAQEFAILKVAYTAGVTVAEPLWVCDDPSIIGAPFFLMRRVAGTAVAARVTRDLELGGDRSTLAERLGVELARIRAIRPPQRDLAFLSLPQGSPALDMIDSSRATLHRFEQSRPVLEWGLRWLERHVPPAGELVLCVRWGIIALLQRTGICRDRGKS